MKPELSYEAEAIKQKKQVQWMSELPVCIVYLFYPACLCFVLPGLSLVISGMLEYTPNFMT